MSCLEFEKSAERLRIDSRDIINICNELKPTDSGLVLGTYDSLDLRLRMICNEFGFCEIRKTKNYGT